jgi:hypothetical protein
LRTTNSDSNNKNKPRRKVVEWKGEDLTIDRNDDLVISEILPTWLEKGRVREVIEIREDDMERRVCKLLLPPENRMRPLPTSIRQLESLTHLQISGQ